jgi:hypothetical protein
MSKLATVIALVTLIASPVFVTPVDAVTFAAVLFGATAAVAITRAELSETTSSGVAQQTPLSPGRGAAVSVLHRPQMRRALLSASRRAGSSSSTQSARGAIVA